jgi:hypothetical protein
MLRAEADGLAYGNSDAGSDPVQISNTRASLVGAGVGTSDSGLSSPSGPGVTIVVTGSGFTVGGMG